MVPGNRVMAVFGFCDIRNFTDTTEVLQEDIMEFVNTIADIVHTEVGTLRPCNTLCMQLLGQALGLHSKLHSRITLRRSCLRQRWHVACI